MKVTIEYDENQITKEDAVESTNACMKNNGIMKYIKPDQNVKFKWESYDVCIMTQKGVCLPIIKAR